MDAVARMSVWHDVTPCFRLEGSTDHSESIRGNWMQLRDGELRSKVPIMTCRLRPGIRLVVSKEISIPEPGHAEMVREGAMHRWVLAHDDTAYRMTCTFYVPEGTVLRGPGPCTMECKFPLANPDESTVRDAEISILHFTRGPMMPAPDFVMALNVIAISLSRAEALERSGALGPFTAKNNGYHMLA